MPHALPLSKLVTAVSVLSLAAVGQSAITEMTDPTGQPLIDRLFSGTSVNTASAVSAVTYVGKTDPGTQGGNANAGIQAGLFDSLTLRGQAGTTLTLGQGIVLTSGSVTNLPTSNTTSAYSNVTGTGGNNYFRDFPAQTGTTRHSGRLQEHDENSITFDLEVPVGVVGVRAEFVYASEEFPEWSGTSFADGFAFIVDDKNYAILPDGRPVSLLRQEDNIHFMTNGDSFDASVPSVADLEYDGVTRVLELIAPLREERIETLTIVVADTGDEIYDSAVFLSSFQFIYGTEPIPGTEAKVRSRSSSEDESFIEFASVPEPAFCAPAYAVLAGLLRRRRTNAAAAAASPTVEGSGM